MKSFPAIAAIVEKHRKGCVLDVSIDGIMFKLGALRVIASTGMGWDHVSVSTAQRLPRYAEMKHVKRICFRADEWAVEYHAPIQDHVNVHPFTLHLWRPRAETFPIPPKSLV